jgi:MFS family permease
LVVTALVFHQTGIFAERGLSATTAGAVFVPFAVASAVSAVIAGILIDRLGPKPVVIAAMSLLLAAMLWLHVVDGPAAAVVYAAVLGSCGAMTQTVSGVIWAHYYGREGLGRVQGTAMMIGIAGAAIGPLPLALMQQAFDSFTTGVVVLSILPVIAIITASRARPAAVAA